MLAQLGKPLYRRAAALLAAALLLATLANGAYGYFARLGVLDRPQFDEIVRNYCGGGPPSGVPLAVGCRCMRLSEGVDYSVAPWPDYIFRTDGYRLVLKLLKEGLFAGVLLFSLAHLPRRPRTRAGGAGLVAPLAFVAVLALGTVLAAVQGGFAAAVPGIRGFEFVAIAALVAWMTTRMDVVGKSLLLLLFLQSVLVAIELLFGMPLRSCPNSFRAAGTLVLPSSLGIFAAMALAFCAAFAPARIGRPWPWLAAAWLVLASGSGTGVVLLLVLGCWQLRSRFVSGAWARVAAVAGLAAVLLLVPVLTQRPQVYDSLFAQDGRVEKAASVLQSATPFELVAGRGIGAGSNAAANASGASLAPIGRVKPAQEPFYADSTITSFLMQFGLAGVAAWLLLLAWAWQRDPLARPFYLLLAIASLVINVTELFPVNFLLGLALAHTLVASGLLRLPAGAAAADADQLP